MTSLFRTHSPELTLTYPPLLFLSCCPFLSLSVSHLLTPSIPLSPQIKLPSLARPFLYDLKGETLMFSTESFAELRRKTVILSVPPELSQFSVADSNRSDTTTATATSPSPDPAPSSSSSSSSTSNPNPSSSSSHSSQVTGSESESGPATGTGTELGSGSESVSEGSIALFVEDLYFVAKDGPLDSVNSKAMSWVLNKISSESDFDEQLTDITAVENLRFRVNEKHPHKLSTSDLIQMYIRSNLTYQLFLIDEKS